MQFFVSFVFNMACFTDEYFLKSIAVVENDWILPKRNMLKELIKMKKHLQVNPVFLSWLGAVRVQPFFFSGIIREPSCAELAMREK